MLEQDEYLHSSERWRAGRLLPGSERFYNDRYCFTVFDAEAGVFGINHIQVSTNRGFGRFRCIYHIGNEMLSYAGKSALSSDLASETLTDGRMAYQVVQPLKKVRLTLDAPQCAFDLTYEVRFIAFDYDECLEGHPLGGPQTTGGHYDQATHCRGEFEVRKGALKGTRLPIDCWANRSHTWDFRFGDKRVWDLAPGEYVWPTIAFPDRHFAFYVGGGQGAQHGRLHEGGYMATAEGRRILRRIKVNSDMGADGCTIKRWDCLLTLPSHEVFRIRSGRKHAQLHMPMYGERDDEGCLDCYYGFFDIEAEESGEQGQAVYEYSFFPSSLQAS